METTLITKTWGEREGVTLDLLKKFTKPGDPRFEKVQCVWNYRGDCTESGDRWLREAMPEEAWEHHNSDTVACTGGIIVVVPRWNSSEEKGKAPGLPAPYWWAMAAIAAKEPEKGCGIRPATDEEIAAVIPATQGKLSELPGLQYMHIERTGFYSTSKKGRQFQPAPGNIRYFRFAAGYGGVAI